MSIITLPAHFDGAQIRLDEPYHLSTNARLLVTILPPAHDEEGAFDEERDDWLAAGRTGLNGAYGDDEVEYSLVDIKEVNPEYAGG